MKHVMKLLTGALIALSAAAFISCNSNKPIPDDLTAKELIQRGQEAFEKGRNKQSLRYFTAVVERYGSDPALYTEATYEIGHLHMRNKNYEGAVEALDSLTKLYAAYPVGTFPPAYEKLAKLELEKIPEDKLAEARKAVEAKQEKERREKELVAQREQIEQELQHANQAQGNSQPKPEEMLSEEPKPQPEAQSETQAAEGESKGTAEEKGTGQ